MSMNMKDVFEGLISKQSYKLEEASIKQISLYKKAYKSFKLKNKKSESKIIIDMDDNIEMINFDGLEMYKFGYEVAKAEI